jgi:hypothetical protein
MQTEPSDGRTSAAEGVCAFLAGLGIRKTSAIHLVGGDALASLRWLCRHGFDKVAILADARAAPEPADLLLALDGSRDTLLQQFGGGAPRLRPGGIVIIRTRLRRRADREQASQLLRRHGLRIERQLRGGRRDVCVARRTASVAAAGR